MHRPHVEPLCSPLAGEPPLVEVLQLFVEELPHRLARLRQLFDAREWHALRQAIRRLGEGVSRHGFDQLVPYLTRLDTALSRREPTPEVAKILAELVVQCGRVSAASH